MPVLPRFEPVVVRLLVGLCRNGDGDAPEQAGVVSHLVRPGESRFVLTFLNHQGHFPVIAGLTRFIHDIQCSASWRRVGVDPVDPGVHTVVMPGLKTGQCEGGLKPTRLSNYIIKCSCTLFIVKDVYNWQSILKCKTKFF